MMGSTNIAQMVPLGSIKGPSELYTKCLKTTSSPEPLIQFQNNFTELFPMMSSTTIAQTVSLDLIEGPPEL